VKDVGGKCYRDEQILLLLRFSEKGEWQPVEERSTIFSVDEKYLTSAYCLLQFGQLRISNIGSLVCFSKRF
jgi:hypothetical protein